MLEKLAEVEKRFDELSALLEDTRIYSDPQRVQKLNRERRSLEEVVVTFRQFRKLEAQIRDNEELQRGADRELAALAQEELPGLRARREELHQRLFVLLLPKDPMDEKNVLLEIRAGTGGEEAALFAADLFRMYTRFAESRRWRVELLGESLAAAGGLKEVVALLSGEAVYSTLKHEAGVHRVQRVPVTEAQGRIHTSTVTVAVMPEADEVDVSLEDKDLEISVCRASGPGGQGVNTTDSAVRIVHVPSGLVVQCQDERSQIKNKARAMKILRSRLLDMKLAEQHAERTQARRSMVGSGERAEKIRTYNFPQNRVTDHRIGLTLHTLDRLMDGELGPLLEAVKAHHQAEALRTSSGA
ncbi:MAG TPA: peptide chain release factor 1 [Myxococcota bacterium]|nr:peptide chain release factor 1 [Myxococcota bacterium]HRY95095.1 peptide chain release factor 1 [Myxococcota bacterium]